MTSTGPVANNKYLAPVASKISLEDLTLADFVATSSTTSASNSMSYCKGISQLFSQASSLAGASLSIQLRNQTSNP